ncbi:MAG: Phosphoserine aminotransferase [Alphaproteobacteria bacterium ADurb.Bin438]|nr:MAG: Phosphoserine aminotransferase [Alphaproteobacteria bacterium ADurb.Bin438]
MLGERGVDVLFHDAFGQAWAKDVINNLRLDDVKMFKAEYGDLPETSGVSKDRDVIFVYNGTTSGVKFDNLDFISNEREGLSICDATSAVFAYDMDWKKLDIVTFSWQKVLGGEAAHGVMILSPRAVKRLDRSIPNWPVPKLFNLKNADGSLNRKIFEGDTINTPSMLCIEDLILALNWAKSVGGLDGLMKRTESNLQAVTDWINTSSWCRFLAKIEKNRSSTSICLEVKDEEFNALPLEEQKAKINEMVSLLEKEKVAYDIKSYKDAPLGLRIWGGATVETSDIKALLPWLDYAFYQAFKGKV